MGKGDLVLLSVIAAIVILSLLVLTLFLSGTELNLNLISNSENEEEEKLYIPVASYTVVEAEMSSFGEGNNPLENTYRLLSISLQNTGDFDLSLQSWGTNLIDWERPVGSKDIVEQERNFIFELEYGNSASSTMVLNQSTSFYIDLKLNYQNGTLSLRLNQHDFTYL